MSVCVTPVFILLNNKSGFLSVVQKAVTVRNNICIHSVLTGTFQLPPAFKKKLVQINLPNFFVSNSPNVHAGKCSFFLPDSFQIAPSSLECSQMPENQFLSSFQAPGDI